MARSGIGNPGLASAITFAPQDEDYSPSGLFMSAHGDFMLRRQRFRPMVEVGALYQPNSDIRSEFGDFDLSQYVVDARVPVAIDPDAYMEVGAYFGARHYSTSSDFPVPDDTLYDVGLNLGGGGFVNDDLLIEGRFFPGIYSDFDDGLTGDDYQWYFEAMAVWRTQESLFWKFGVAHDGIYKDLEVYPLLGVSYVFNSQWRLDILLPRYAELSFSPGESDSTILVLDVNVDGNQYEMHSSAVSGSSTSHVQEIRVGLGGIFRFTDMWSMYGKVGATVGGDYQLTSGNGVFATGTMEPALFFAVGLGVDF